MRSLPAWGVAACLVLGSACGDPRGTTGATDGPAALSPVAAGAEWPVASPAEAGLDPSRLLDLVARIRRREYGTVDSLLVARGGRLVVEEYFGGWSEGRAHTVQSATKSVTSLLAGLAISEGRVGIHDRVVDLFPGYEPLANDDDRKRGITLADLLTMRTGLDWSEATYSGSPLERLNGCGCDWLRFVLDWPMREQPGARWEYVSGGTILLGGAIGAATGERVDRYADSRLFGPLGVRGATWARGLPDGLPHTGGGLDLRPRDMAKLGALIVDGGRWQGRQVVPEAWIRESTARVVHAPRYLGSHAADYGYLWWLLDLDDPMNPRPLPGDVVTAAGARGQWIFAVPRLALVVVVTSSSDDRDWARPIDFLYTHVIPAVQP